MQAAERAHNFVVDFRLQTTSTVVKVLRCRSPIRSLPSRLIRRTLTQMSNIRRSPSLISVSVELDHPGCRKPHGSLRSFSLTGTIFLSIPNHFARIQSSKSQYFTSSNLFYVVLISTFFLLKACFKSLQAYQTSRWLVQLPWRHAPRLLVMHVVFISLLKIFVYMLLSKHASCRSAIRPINRASLHY